MEMINKPNIFYSIVDAQGIRVMVNTRTTTSTLASQATTVSTMIPSPTLVVEILTPIPEVDKLVLIRAVLLGILLPSYRFQMSSLPGFLTLLRMQPLLFQHCIYPSFRISLRGISWN